MKRIVLVVAAVGLVLAACSSSDDTTAATVGSTVIVTSEVEGLTYAAEGDLSPDQFAQLLGALVQWTAIEQVAGEEFGLEPTEEEIDAGVDQIVTDFSGGATLDEFLESQDISEVVLRRSAVQTMIDERVQTDVADSVGQVTVEEAEQALVDAPLDWTVVCAAHILVETEEEATEVLSRLEAGEEFAAVAQEVSTDTGSGATGGDLGCAAAATYVPEFAEATMSAEIGEVTAAVETQFGFHLIRVDSRNGFTSEEVRQSMFETRIAEAVDAWYTDALTNADVTVEAEYGTWQTDPFPQVAPPA